MNKNQQFLLNFFKKLAGFLDEKEITYYVTGGTALGTVRHKGFIPWDNDIDINIDRFNYEKLLSCRDELERLGMELCWPESDKPFNKALSAVSDLTSTSMIISEAYRGDGLGRMIDIIVLDPVPHEKVEEYLDVFNMYEEVMIYQYVGREDMSHRYDEYKHYKEREAAIGTEELLKEFREKLESYIDDDADTWVPRWGVVREHYDREMFSEPRKMPFEDMIVSAPTQVERYLRERYGDDWFVIPEKEDREIIEFWENKEISFNNYAEDFYKFFNPDEAKIVLEERKDYEFQRLIEQRKLERLGAKTTVIGNNILLKKREEEIAGLAERGDYQAVVDCSDVLWNQSKIYAIADMVPEISDETYSNIVYSLIETGKYYLAIKMRKNIKKTIRQDVNEYLDRVKTEEDARQDSACYI